MLSEVLTLQDMQTLVRLLERHGEDRLADTFRAVMDSTPDGWARVEGMNFEMGAPTPRPPVGGSAVTSVDSLGV